MYKTNSIFILLLLCSYARGQSIPTPLKASHVFDLVIEHYDPTGKWENYRGEMHLYTLQPDGGSTEEDLVIDNEEDFYQSTLFINGTVVTRGIRQDSPFFEVNGRSEPTAEERSAYSLTEENLQTLYHHHKQHFGLPMHLKEMGLVPEEGVFREDFNGKSCLVLKFNGSGMENTPAYFENAMDLLIHPDDHSIAGVRFPNDSEQFPAAYVVYSDEMELQGIRIPKVKTYYRLADDSYWFTDAFYPFTREQYGGIEEEKVAIRKVLDDETFYFYVRDYNKWGTCWSHQDDVFFSSTSKEGYSIKKGWEEVSEHIRNYMRENPDPHRPAIERTNFVYHLQGNLVWVYFDNREGDVYGRHQRVLRKEDGNWKVINMTAINESSFEE